MASASTPPLRFWIAGSVVPKARPRVTRNGTYLPQRYRDWRQMAETEMLVQIEPSVRASLPIHRASIQILLQGLHKGDADNLCGSVLDSLVACGVLLDDRLTCVPSLAISHEPKGVHGVWVEVKALL